MFLSAAYCVPPHPVVALETKAPVVSVDTAAQPVASTSGTHGCGSWGEEQHNPPGDA